MPGTELKILTVHNRYKFRGGEDESREAEDLLLAARGNEIRQIVFDNAIITSANALRVGLGAVWSGAAYKRVGNYLDQWRPDILDVHNFFPLASPSIYYAAARRGIPIVQTLHNYRIICPGANFYRNGSACEDCTAHSIPWPGVIHGCYRDSSLQTAAVALMITAHRLLRTWNRLVSAFFVLSEFSKRKFVEAGLPAERMVVKPNFVVDPGGPGPGGHEFLFAGRLSPEKGIKTLLEAIKLTRSPNAVFRIAGDGPLDPSVRAAAASDPRIIYTGRLPLAEIMDLMATSRAVLVPSECYETFGRAAAEAFACGTPVICADNSAVTEIVSHQRTGFHFRSSDPQDLARVLDQTMEQPQSLAAMRQQARADYLAKYTPEMGYQILTSTYASAISRAQTV